MEERLRREGSLLGGAEAAELGREVDALRRSIDRTRARLQQQFGERVDQELARAWPEMEAAVAEYAREASYDLVLSSPQLYARSEEHTSELQSRENLVCRLLLEKKKKIKKIQTKQ